MEKLAEDIADTDIAPAAIDPEIAPAAKRARSRNRSIFTRALNMDLFLDPYSQYFYGCLRTRNYDFIKLLDEIVVFNCHSNARLSSIFVQDLQFEVNLPIQEKSKAELLIFCRNVYESF